MDKQAVIEATRRWISSIVIGLNLCPFAQRVFQTDKIRYVVTLAHDEVALLQDLAAELKALVSSPISTVETTLLIHPCALGNFRDYNDLLGDAERLVGDLGLRGTIQIANFHPDYQFAGTDPGAVENYTNRSPHPMLHLLREASISAVASDPNELLEIPRRNIKTLRGLGREQVLEKLKALADGLERQP
ncbi:MAG TPA: DUF1415 domain-containing protein [Gemmataceae bacterium]|nr:DUF1415 domain-containing protein [Gemmataceae bacterium]